MNGGEPPLTYNQFQAIVASMDPPIPAMPTLTLEHLKNVYTPISEDHDERYGVPTLLELGKKKSFTQTETAFRLHFNKIIRDYHIYYILSDIS